MEKDNEAFVAAKAEEVAALMARAGVPEPVAFDPTSLLVVAELIAQAFKMLQDCKFAGPPEQRLANPGLFDRLRLRRLVNAEVRGTRLAGRADEVREALLEAGRAVGAEQARALMASEW